MPLVTTTEMFKKAYEGGYAVGAFNVNNMEIVQGIVDAAKEEQSPLILQVSAGARKYAKHIYLVKLVEAALEDSNLPIALHLDHGDSFEICKDCVDGGFTSVMIDASHHDFDENVKITKQVVEYAHAHGVVVEAELGRLAGVEDDVNVSDADARFTDPEQAAEFVALTGVDSLAIAIGTSHGAYKFKGTPYLDFERLEKVGKLLPNFPIVLHGASSVLPEFVERTVSCVRRRTIIGSWSTIKFAICCIMRFLPPSSHSADSTRSDAFLPLPVPCHAPPERTAADSSTPALPEWDGWCR